MVSWDRYPDAEPEQAILAQLVERLICNQDVVGSIPTTGTNNRGFRRSDTGFICQLGEGSLPSAASQNNAGIVQLVEMTLSGSSLEVRHRPSKSADESRTQVQILSAAQCHFKSCREFKPRCPLHF